MATARSSCSTTGLPSPPTSSARRRSGWTRPRTCASRRSAAPGRRGGKLQDDRRVRDRVGLQVGGRRRQRQEAPRPLPRPRDARQLPAQLEDGSRSVRASATTSWCVRTGRPRGSRRSGSTARAVPLASGSAQGAGDLGTGPKPRPQPHVARPHLDTQEFPELVLDPVENVVVQDAARLPELNRELRASPDPRRAGGCGQLMTSRHSSGIAQVW